MVIDVSTARPFPFYLFNANHLRAIRFLLLAHGGVNIGANRGVSSSRLHASLNIGETLGDSKVARCLASSFFCFFFELPNALVLLKSSDTQTTRKSTN